MSREIRSHHKKTLLRKQYIVTSNITTSREEKKNSFIRVRKKISMENNKNSKGNIRLKLVGKIISTM